MKHATSEDWRRLKESIPAIEDWPEDDAVNSPSHLSGS